MTKAMAIDHARHGIRVNCLCPGDVETPMLDEDARMRGMSWQEYHARKSSALSCLRRLHLHDWGNSCR